MTTDRVPLPLEAIDTCARAAHETNRIYCRSHGDLTQAHWEQAPEWQRQSARQGVLGAVQGKTPEESHEAWMKQKTHEGWVYGPIKDVDKREHPCMRPYTELTIQQQQKDRLFIRVVRAMAHALGFPC
jgi:RyR domain